MKTVKDVNIKNKTVLIRCDFNVPIKEGKIVDDTRIKESLKTIKYCLDEKSKVVLFSHLGRVKENADLEKNNLYPVAIRLSELLKKEVLFIEKTRGEELEEAIASMKNGDIILIQNTRYEDLDGKKESSNDLELGKYWASLGDVFINDAFGTIHRAHASNVGISSYIKEKAVGFLIEKELKALKELDEPEHPYTVILGGAKVRDKIGVIENLVKKADHILICGGMAFTFLKAEGYEIGNSLLDQENIDFCTKILKENPDKIILPVDVKVTKEYRDDSNYVEKTISEIDFDEMGLDIGSNTVRLFQNYLTNSKIVVWNGPLGVYEFSNFSKGTDEVLNYIVENNIKTILGGGDIVAAASNANVKDKLYHVSTGGGATLEYLEGKELPGLKVIN